MNEQSKSAKRRFNSGKYHSRYFVGNGIDIGAGDDCLANYMHVFRGITSCRGWDLGDGDAQYLETIQDNTYDFAVSSHCLEHMRDPFIALDNWVRVVKPGGYIIVTIPDQYMYEHNHWPSRYNGDHKWSFRMGSNSPDNMLNSIYMIDLLSHVGSISTIDKLEYIDEFYSDDTPHWVDQTMTPNTECAIEFILRKL